MKIITYIFSNCKHRQYIKKILAKCPRINTKMAL